MRTSGTCTKTAASLFSASILVVLFGCSSGGGGGGDIDAGDTETSDQCAEGCLIDSTCVPHGFINPASPCLFCDVAESTTTWSDNDGATCDDDLFCTVDDVCGGGSCAGTPKDCSDGVSCTGTETCDEDANTCLSGTTTCSSDEICDAVSDTCVTTCPGCLVGAVCYGDGQSNPTNPCQKCDVSLTQSAWSDNDGVACDDGEFCTVNDTCSSGACSGTARDCSDGVDCTGTETCAEDAGVCLSGTTTCSSVEICDAVSDTCVATCPGCLVATVCYGNGQANPANICQKCNVSLSQSAWSDNDGVACDDGEFCTVDDTCSGGACSGTARDCSDGLDCTGTETCAEDAGVCLPGTTTCPSEEICDAISDTCVETCPGCLIDTVCYGDGQANPTNPCQRCEISISQSTWSDNDGAACDDGEFCNGTDTCSGGTCSVGSGDPCGDDGVFCNGTESCNEGSGSCDHSGNPCGTDYLCMEIGDTCVDVCTAPLVECDDNCVNTNNDPHYCGSCTNDCTTPANAIAVCASSVCAAVCDYGYEDCDYDMANGCEKNLQTDPDNCGACGNTCDSGGCASGECYKRVFVTSTTHNGAMGGLAGADAICQARATAAGLSGTYMAWLSDSTGSPSTRFTQSEAPYVLVNGTVIANDWYDLTDGSIDNYFNRNEFGATVSSSSYPYTSTTAAGTLIDASRTCSNWTATSGPVYFGCTDSTSSSWSICWGGVNHCAMSMPLYCFEQ